MATRPNRWQRRPLRWTLPLLLAAGLVLLQWRVPTWADRPEAWTLDARFSLRGPEEPGIPLVIIAVDEDSFQLLADLKGENVRTWPRARWADLLEKINADRPRAVGLDLVFDTPGWDPGGDEALAAALATAGNAVLPINLHQLPTGDGERNTISPPYLPLATAAAALGVVSVSTDADGAVRRLTPLTLVAGELYPAFALTIATIYGRAPIDLPAKELGDDFSLPIRFRGPEGTYPTVSLVDVWLDRVDPELFADAVVLIGYTTQLEQDRHLAPFAGEHGLPGVEIQANAVDTLLSGAWLHRPPAWLPPLLMALATLAAALLLNLRHPAAGLLSVLALLMTYLLVGLALFVRADLILPLVSPLAGALLVGATALAERMIFAEREKRLMRQRFAGVMSPERLRAVMENWEELLDLEQRVKEGTVLFADVRGFTEATERLMRSGRGGEMVAFLSAHLDTMAAAIFDQGGVIYRMLGDGLLVLFGLPESLPNHALGAVRAAANMAAAGEDLQAIWPFRDEGPFGIGIGIHSGLIADGIVGRGRRLDYAVFGDAVNTAARIESHCKVSMEVPRSRACAVPDTVEILLSAELYQKVRQQVEVDDNIPPFEARGKSAPLHVVRLLGLLDKT